MVGPAKRWTSCKEDGKTKHIFSDAKKGCWLPEQKKRKGKRMFNDEVEDNQKPIGKWCSKKERFNVRSKLSVEQVVGKKEDRIKRGQPQPS